MYPYPTTAQKKPVTIPVIAVSSRPDELGPGPGGPDGVPRPVLERPGLSLDVDGLVVPQVGPEPFPGFIFGRLARNPRFDKVTRRPGYSRGPSGS